VADLHSAGRIVSALEGGYNLSALARSVAAHVRTLAQL
jgi:acetoin utilization deacetylase AcuC-like enzyme